MSTQELLAMPYNQRRIIVVRDDATGAMMPAAPTAPAVREFASSFLYGRLALLAADLVKARRAMRQGGENLIPVSSVDAAQLHFPVGHPRRKVAYIGHPVDPPVYIPVADFHRFLFEHKVAEALRLIRSLGAVTVEVIRVEGWDQSVGIALGAVLPTATKADIGASASQERSSAHSVLSTMRLKPTQSTVSPAATPAGAGK